MRLRVIDFGYVPALRSQAVYHGLAEAISADDDPVLSLVNPNDPYVCVGVHQEIAKEVDEDFCAERACRSSAAMSAAARSISTATRCSSTSSIRAAKAPEYAVNLYPMFIEPAVRTYRELGVAAEYRPINDIQVAGRKIGGTGAASIGEATVMVGSFMFDFDTATMARCLKVPSEKFRDKLKTTLDDYMTTMTRELDDAAVARRGEGAVPQALRGRARRDAGRRPADGGRGEGDRRSRRRRSPIPPGPTARAASSSNSASRSPPAPISPRACTRRRGGLIRAHLVARDGTIADLMLSGDFTCLPEDGADRLAAALAGVKLDEPALTTAADAAMRSLGLDMPGVEPADIATVVMAAVEPAG